MRTTGNNIPFNGSEYDNENDIASYYIGGYLVATLDVGRDIFEDHEEISEEDKQLCYLEMINRVSDFKANEYLQGEY